MKRELIQVEAVKVRTTTPRAHGGYQQRTEYKIDCPMTGTKRAEKECMKCEHFYMRKDTAIMCEYAAWCENFNKQQNYVVNL